MNTDRGPEAFIGRPHRRRTRDRGLFLVPTVRLSIGTVAVLLIGRGLLRLLGAMWRHPVATLITGALLAGWIAWGPTTLAIVVGSIVFTAVAGGLVWRYADEVTFGRWVRTPARSKWRRRWVYERNWQPAMVLTGLGRTVHGSEYLPIIRRVRSTDRRDLVQVSMTAGQTASDFAEVASQLAATFGAVRMTIRRDTDPSRLWLDFHRTGGVTTLTPRPHQPGRSKSPSVA
ncbi:SoxR reducing system RseC family protein [Fodinicola acaciae]|uniref:SoxR reducing system RseC family protein n=1 Tax=Fodinicola acaciae TaxID=2681555 RepID=UPI0013D89997|nr:SoxR reducing system RseC family protein [Fodinicola acaciae]